MTRIHQIIDTDEYWTKIFIAGGQVTFGVIAAIWFITPFNFWKFVIIILMATAIYMAVFKIR